MLSAWNLRCLSKAMEGEAGQPGGGSEEAAAMFWSKKTRHLKEFYSSLDVAVRRKENALCALALKAAPLPPSLPHDSDTF